MAIVPMRTASALISETRIWITPDFLCLSFAFNKGPTVNPEKQLIILNIYFMDMASLITLPCLISGTSMTNHQTVYWLYNIIVRKKNSIPFLTKKLTSFYSWAGLLDMNTPLHEKWLPGQIDLGRSSFQLNVQLVLIHWPEDIDRRNTFPWSITNMWVHGNQYTVRQYSI